MKQDTAAVVVAGGSGKRFGSSVRKQYLTLAGRPVLEWSVQAFERAPSVGVIVLVVPPEDVARLQQRFIRHTRKPVFVVEGGKERADSVRCGLAVIPSGFRWIAVHDAVRPMVTPALIEAVLKQTRRHRAAIAATPSKDSVKLATLRETIQKSLPRQSVWLAQTPQAFERKLLERAHQQGKHLAATDDSMLVERLGVRVKLVDGTPDNLKVTLPSDLHLAERLLKGRR